MIGSICRIEGPLDMAKKLCIELFVHVSKALNANAFGWRHLIAIVHHWDERGSSSRMRS